MYLYLCTIYIKCTVGTRNGRSDFVKIHDFSSKSIDVHLNMGHHSGPRLRQQVEMALIHEKLMAKTDDGWNRGKFAEVAPGGEKRGNVHAWWHLSRASGVHSVTSG